MESAFPYSTQLGASRTHTRQKHIYLTITRSDVGTSESRQLRLDCIYRPRSGLLYYLAAAHGKALFKRRLASRAVEVGAGGWNPPFHIPRSWVHPAPTPAESAFILPSASQMSGPPSPGNFASVAFIARVAASYITWRQRMERRFSSAGLRAGPLRSEPADGIRLSIFHAAGCVSHPHPPKAHLSDSQVDVS